MNTVGKYLCVLIILCSAFYAWPEPVVNSSDSQELEKQHTIFSSQAEEQAILLFLQKHADKERYVALLELREKNPAAYQQQLKSAAKDMQLYEDIKHGKANPLQRSFLQQVEKNKATATATDSGVTLVEEQAILAFVKKHSPKEYAAMLLELQQKDSAAYRRELWNVKESMRLYEDMNQGRANPLQQSFFKQQTARKSSLLPSTQTFIGPEEEQAIILFVREFYPKEYHRELLDLKENNPAAYQQQLKSFKIEKAYYDDMRAKNPQEFQRMIKEAKQGKKVLYPEILSARRKKRGKDGKD